MNVIFLAYADSEAHPLFQLREEFDKVYEILTANLPENYQIHPDNHSTIGSINKYLGEFSTKISLFNYSGHAGNQYIFLDDKIAHSNGIIFQLKESVEAGTLKLVILNGCATHGQVEKLQKIGVPAIVATNAPVDDECAKEFAVRFYSDLFKEQLTIRQAYQNAIIAAQLGTAEDLLSRHLKFEDTNHDQPVWDLIGLETDLQTNPFVVNQIPANTEYRPLSKLLTELFDAFVVAGNPQIIDLAKKGETEIVETHEKRDAILNIIPFPIAENLKKLINIEASSEFNNDNDKRVSLLKQMAQLYHTTTEFICFIMIAQLWELKLKSTNLQIPGSLKDALKDYFYCTRDRRKIFNYPVLIGSLREFFETAMVNYEAECFVTEQEILKDIVQPGNRFGDACNYLHGIRKETILDKSRPNIVRECQRTENELCNFFKLLGFLHRYHLTSIAQIDILKFRHLSREKTKYKHKIIKLMKPQQNSQTTIFHYFMPDFLDNWGVVLIKGHPKETVIDPGTFEIEVEAVDFLNLSPFVIDRMVFEEKRNISNLMFFNQYFTDKDSYEFNDVSNPDKLSDYFRVDKAINPGHKKYELKSIHLQFEAFRSSILGEINS